MDIQNVYIGLLTMTPIIGIASVLLNRGYFSYFLFANVCINSIIVLYLELTEEILNMNTFLYYYFPTVVFVLLDYFYESKKERKMLRELEDGFKIINDKKHKKVKTKKHYLGH